MINISSGVSQLDGTDTPANGQNLMADADRTLGMFLHLARASHMRRQPMVRDKLLVLAGVQAEQMGLDEISALCRHKILAHNARHLVRGWPTLTAALADEKFQSYLKQLKRRYSTEKTEHILHSLGIELGREREAYFNDLEYAAALLDTRPSSIAAILARDPSSLSVDGSEVAVDELRVDESRGYRRERVASAWSRQRISRWLRDWAPWLLAALAAALIAAVQMLGR
jgi:hypothetical protein